MPVWPTDVLIAASRSHTSTSALSSMAMAVGPSAGASIGESQSETPIVWVNVFRKLSPEAAELVMGALTFGVW